MSAALQAGSTISHYRVVSPLGAGGMGEVYLARDESLERSVALKVLPPELVRNEERVRRFIQEAKSASSLSHPNIVTIYEIGRAEVSADGGGAPGALPVHFIAMELVSGDTLKHKIHQEKADLRTLLGFLAQAAEGLAKAHAAGIVHRDLKPENIMVSKDGFAKVLDFGLAKLVENADIAEDITSLPTRAGERTREGAVLGTVSYMSPEQVRGWVVDHRADVFAFGSILYEAATRRKAFAADSDVETMHRILHDKPAPVETQNPEAPAVLRRLIRRCLAKNPEQRFQSMKDIALELAEIVEDFDDLSTSGSTTSATAASALAVSRGRRRPAWLVPVVTAAAVVVALIAVRGLSTRGAHPRVAPFQDMRLTRLTSDGRIGTAALSPDGRYLAHVIRDAGRFSLWVKQVATGSQVRIVEPLDTPFRGVAFSTDGNYVYYVNQETGGPGYSNLYQVPALGGASKRMLFDIDTAPAFSPDGSRFAFMRGYPQESETALLIANADGSGERRLLALKDPETFLLATPSWSPDGDRIAAVMFGREGGIHNRVVIVDVVSGDVERLGGRWFDINELTWLPDGGAIVLSGTAEGGEAVRQIWLMSYPRGDMARVTNDLNNYIGVTVTADGKSLATAQISRIANAWSVTARGAGTPKQLTFVNVTDGSPSKAAALPGGGLVYDAGRAEDAHLFALGDDGRARPLTSGKGMNFSPFVATASGTIVYTAIRDDRIPHVWRMDRDGANAAQVTRGSGELVLGVSPEGDRVYYTDLEKREAFRAPIAGGAPEVFGKLVLGDVSHSPDGTRIAYSGWVQQGERVERRMLVVAAAGGAPIWSHPYPDGSSLHWDPAGDALTYQRETDGVGNVWRQPLDGGPPRQITRFTESRMFDYDWAPDGTLYAVRGDVRSDVVLIQNFR